MRFVQRRTLLRHTATIADGDGRGRAAVRELASICAQSRALAPRLRCSTRARCTALRDVRGMDFEVVDTGPTIPQRWPLVVRKAASRRSMGRIISVTDRFDIDEHWSAMSARGAHRRSHQPLRYIADRQSMRDRLVAAFSDRATPVAIDLRWWSRPPLLLADAARLMVPRSNGETRRSRRSRPGRSRGRAAGGSASRRGRRAHATPQRRALRRRA